MSAISTTGAPIVRWTTCALRAEDTCVASKRPSWKDYRDTSAWRPPSRLSAGRMIFQIDFFCALQASQAVVAARQ
jgi:hypothetical protein